MHTTVTGWTCKKKKKKKKNQTSCMTHLSRLVVEVAVGEHEVDVVLALLGAPVVVVLQPPPHRRQVHRALDDLEVVRQPQLHRVHRGEEGPAVLVLDHAWDENKRGQQGKEGRSGRGCH